jgi:hypothetical protein
MSIPGFALAAAAPPYRPPAAQPVSDEGSELQTAVAQATEQRQDVRAEAERLLREAGVNVEHPKVIAILDSTPEEILSPQGQGLVAVFAALYPSSAQTAYSKALSEAGFLEGFPELPLAAAEAQALRHKPGVTPATFGKPTDYAIEPDTGWVMYRSGVLFDPTSNQVIFEPNSMAPGSPLYLRKVTEKWSEDKVAEWRSRLADFGYLTAEQGKASGVDQTFLEALRTYHVARYQSFGKALPLDISAAAGGRPDLTARDFQAQIRNAVREQYRRVFDNDPTDAELEDWAGFVTNTSLRIQRRLIRQRGLTSDQALGVATTEAEERLIERLEGSPQAEFLEESVEENTRLRDGLAQAARVTAAFG